MVESFPSLSGSKGRNGKPHMGGGVDDRRCVQADDADDFDRKDLLIDRRDRTEPGTRLLGGRVPGSSTSRPGSVRWAMAVDAETGREAQHARLMEGLAASIREKG